MKFVRFHSWCPMPRMAGGRTPRGFVERAVQMVVVAARHLPATQERVDRSNTAASVPRPFLHGPGGHRPTRSPAMSTTIDSMRALARAFAGAAGLMLAGAVWAQSPPLGPPLITVDKTDQ